MAVRKIDGHWYVDFRFRRARLRQRSPLNTKEGAEQYERALRGELSIHGNLERLDPIQQKVERERIPTFAAFAEQWLVDYAEVYNKPSEVSTKIIAVRTTLTPLIGHLRLNEITTSVVEWVKAELIRRKLAPKTVNNKMAILRKCLATAMDREIIDRLPRFHKLRVPPQAFRYLSEAECTALLTAADGLWYAMILTALRTGLRYSELSALRWEDIDLATGLVVVQRGQVRGIVGSPKSNRIRHVWLTSDAVQAVLTLPRAKSGWVFHLGGELVSYRSAERAMEKIARTASLGRIGWHALRHTFASHLAMKGVAIQVIKDLLGHATMQMTLRYAHLSLNELRAATLLLDPNGSRLGSRWAGMQNTPAAPTCLAANDFAQLSQERALVPGS